LQTSGLPELAAKRGKFSIESGNTTSVIRMRDLRITTSAAQGAAAQQTSTPTASRIATKNDPLSDAALRQPHGIAEQYRPNLAALSGRSLTSDTHSGFTTCQAEIDGLTLRVAIDPADHTIQGMSAEGATGEVTKRLLAVLADLCHGLPILEAADHGALKLEYKLRRSGSRPRPGIVIAECTDPAFSFISALLRAILADYRRQTGFKDIRNNFDVAAGPRWMNANEAGRKALLNEAFTASGFASEVATVVAIEYDVRVVVALTGIPAGQAARTLTLLERAAKERVDPRLELFLSELKDSNKLRRLSEHQGKAS
jgi:hypothetical protein